MTELVRLAAHRGPPGLVVFDRHELNQLLAVYATRVAQGEWRDYAIDHRPHMAAFAVFRRSADWPLYVVAKLAAGRRQRRFVLFSGEARIGQGRSLDEVLSRLPAPA